MMLRTTQREVSPGDGRDNHCTPYFQRSLVTIRVRCDEIRSIYLRMNGIAEVYRRPHGSGYPDKTEFKSGHLVTSFA